MMALRSPSVSPPPGRGWPFGPFGAISIQIHRHGARCEIRMSRAHRGSACNDAVEVERIALRHEHRFASAGGAADEVGVRYRLAVITLDDLFREHGDAPVRDVCEVESGLLILHEAAIERAAGALMSGIGCRNGEPANQSRPIARRLRSGGFSNGAIEATAALLQILSGPVVGKSDCEADAVGLAVRSCALVHHAIEAAMRGQFRSGCASAPASCTGRASCRHRFSARDFQSYARALELCHVRALGVRLGEGGDLHRYREDGDDGKLHRFLLTFSIPT